MAFLFIIILGIVIYYFYKAQKKKEQHLNEIHELQNQIKEQKTVEKEIIEYEEKLNNYKILQAEKGSRLFDKGYSPLPENVKNKRKLYRMLYSEAKKQEDESQMIENLDKLYKLGIVYTACYGNRDCTKSVKEEQLNDAITWLTNNLSNLEKYNYKDYGIIHDCGIISENDWKRFFATFGLINKDFYLLKELYDAPGKKIL